MAMKATLSALITATMLSACGTAADDPLLGAARSFASGVFNSEPEARSVDPRQVLTRDIINQAGLPLILLENAATNGNATLVRVAENGPNETWQGEGDSTVTLSREGVLRATRGTGPDLFASDITGIRAALTRRQTSPFQRTYAHVEGDLEQSNSVYTCNLEFGPVERLAIFGQAHSLTRATENCTPAAGGDAFTNRYWLDSSGFIWISEQWAGQELGHFRIERLFR